jgi:hypothetical protein
MCLAVFALVLLVSCVSQSAETFLYRKGRCSLFSVITLVLQSIFDELTFGGATSALLLLDLYCGLWRVLVV